MKERHCMEHLTTLLGMLDENIANDFEAIDENGDGFVSKQESFKAIDRDNAVSPLLVGAPPSMVYDGLTVNFF